MSQKVIEEFERELAAIRVDANGDAHQEMIQLWLMAVEREEVASMAYRDVIISERLARMDVSESVKALIRYALIWIWKDEEMHTVYTRGALYRYGSNWLKFRTLTTQLAGALGGWAASIQQQLTWNQAPFRRLLAKALLTAGSAFGQIPEEVKEHIEHGSFRQFCQFNIEAEVTALLCWERIVELAESELKLPEEQVRSFRRVCRDERNHQTIFEALVEALDETDRITSDQAAVVLEQKIRAVGEQFLPPELREQRRPEVFTGRGGRVTVSENKKGEELDAFFTQFLRNSGMIEAIKEAADIKKLPIAEMKVVVKPTLMYAFSKRDRTSYVKPELLRLLAGELENLGIEKRILLEGPNLYSEYFHGRSVAEVASLFAYDQLGYELRDASLDSIEHRYFHGMGQHAVSKTWQEADFRISFSKLRTHPYNIGYYSIDNLEGLGEPSEDYIFTERYAELHTTNLMLLHDFPVHFSLIDAYEDIADGQLGLFGSPNPHSPHRLYGGRDPISVDLVVGRHTGLTNPSDSQFTGSAVFWFGDPRAQIDLLGTDETIAGWKSPNRNLFSSLLRVMAHPVYEFASFRGQLFFPEVDEELFPRKESQGPFLRLLNRLVRGFFGLSLPNENERA